MPDELEGNVVLLDRNLLRGGDSIEGAVNCLHMVPTLHIDCNEDIDITDQDLMLYRNGVRALISL